MKEWQIVYRTPKGNKECLIIKAENRHGVFEELSKRKINPILITPVDEQAGIKTISNTLLLRSIVIVVLFCLTVIIGIWIAFKNDHGPIQVVSTQPIISSVKTNFADVEKTVSVTTKKNENDLPNEKKDYKRYERGVAVVSCETLTNKTSGAVIEKLVLANGKRIQKIYPAKPIFENPSDQLIATVLSVKPGQSLPPLPNLNGIDVDFKKSLKTPIKFDENDSSEVRELKALVLEARVYLENELKNGGTIVDALYAHQAEMNRISDSRLMAIQQIRKIESEEGFEASVKFAELINESLRLRNIPEVSVPKKPSHIGEGENQ